MGRLTETPQEVKLFATFQVLLGEQRSCAVSLKGRDQEKRLFYSTIFICMFEVQTGCKRLEVQRNEPAREVELQGRMEASLTVSEQLNGLSGWLINVN